MIVLSKEASEKLTEAQLDHLKTAFFTVAVTNMIENPQLNTGNATHVISMEGVPKEHEYYEFSKKGIVDAVVQELKELDKLHKEGVRIDVGCVITELPTRIRYDILFRVT